MTTSNPIIEAPDVGRVRVTVPTDTDLATEPATVIAKAQAIKVAVVAVLSIVGITLSPELSDNIDTLIQSAVAVAFGVYALWSTWRQGQETRQAVYSPAAVKRVAQADVVEVLSGNPSEAGL